MSCTNSAAEHRSIECYSLSINNDGTKLASGGLDGKVKIWDVQSILRYKLESEQPEMSSLQRRMETQSAHELERPLASMTRHNGVVTCVKFSPDGRFLASASDDKIVLIWEKDDDQNRPKQFGETEADLEHWTVRKRLVAHDNDVQDISWSPDGALLISVGLDRSIIIWSGTTFERIKRYDIHQSMVKGIVFDPANKFFVTASDDRTVRIFRYYRKFNDVSSSNYEFQMEQIIMDPFKKSPLTSYFRRMSWSPDGQHIAVPNATNGPVTSVVIINRGNWATDVSLIGHEAPCEVCSFSPRIFRLDKSAKTEKLTTILASGGQDRTLAIWSTALTRPLVVAEDIVQNSITDICWSPDGESLFLSALDGSITCVAFDKGELGEVVSEDVNDSQLVRYCGTRDSAIFPESAEQLLLESIMDLTESASSQKIHSTQGEPSQKVNTSSITKDAAKQSLNHVEGTSAKPNDTSDNSATLSKHASNEKSFNLIEARQSPKPTLLSQKVKIMKNGKKRVAPLLVSQLSGSSKSSSSIPSSTKVSKQFDIASKMSQTSYFLPRLGLQTSVHGLRLRAIKQDVEDKNRDQDNDNEDMGFDESHASRMQAISTASVRRKIRKYKKFLMELRYPTPFKMVSLLPEVLYKDQAVMNNELHKIIHIKDMQVLTNSDLISTAALDSINENLLFRVIVNSIEHMGKPFTDLLEHEELHQNGMDLDEKNDYVTSIVEIRNGLEWAEDDESMNMDVTQRVDFQDPTQVIVTNDEKASRKSYILYFPFKIQQVVPIIFEGKLAFYVLVSFHGTVQIIRAESGIYVTPSMEMGSNVVVAKQNGAYLLLLTSSGLLFSWKFPNYGKGQRMIEAVLKGVSVAPALNCETALPETLEHVEKKNILVPHVSVENLRALEVDERTGMPYIILENSSTVYSYCASMMIWTKVMDSWHYLCINEQKNSGDLFPNTASVVMEKLFNDFQEKVQKGARSKYTFNESNQELQESMAYRLRESIEFINA